jgi:hypothetical protein
MTVLTTGIIVVCFKLQQIYASGTILFYRNVVKLAIIVKEVWCTIVDIFYLNGDLE